ncbi:MAG: hypothetical protein V4671_11030 [Armatimonadota bacterium]
MNKPNRTSNFSTRLNAPIARIPAGISPQKRSRRIPVCLFLERFSLQDRELVLGRFYSSSAVQSNNELLNTSRPSDLVRYVRNGILDTMSEFETLTFDLREEVRPRFESLRSFRDRLDEYPDEAEAFALHVLETCQYRDMLLSEGARTL